MKFLIIVFMMMQSLFALERSKKTPFKGHEKFDDKSIERFSSFSPKNSTFRNGVLWTRGESGRKYPPTVRIPIAVKDCTISFRYRFLADKGSIQFFTGVL